MLNKKAYLQISFSWLFAIIVGAIILFLAIYFLTSFIKTGQTERGAKASQEIGILLNPLEVGFEQGKKSMLSTSTETRIYTSCEISGNFGRQGISIKEKIYNQWSEFSEEIIFKNKYIFAENPVEGRSFYLFSKPFDFPFEVASLIYLIPENQNYCFVKPPKDIQNEIENLGFENIFMNTLTETNCKGTEVKVCFSSLDSCDISVDCDNDKCSSGITTRGGKELGFYSDSLMYATIFSKPSTYECQLKRLLKRTSILAKLYEQKLTLSSFLICQNYISSELSLFRNSIDVYLLDFSASSIDLDTISKSAGDLYTTNRHTTCKLW